ncbi:MAG: type II toxin-antitoxin system VapC family toxin [Thiohalomonadales bacterium]
MSKFLLDTCVISDFIKGEPGTLQALKSCQPADTSISAITMFEIDYGLALNPTRAKKISTLISALVLSIEILPFTQDTGKYAADVRSILKQKGKPIGPYDLLISGTALEHGLTLVTANDVEFSSVKKLELVNWRH